MNTIVHTPTSDLKQSIAFYQKLNYKLISEEKPTLFTEGKAIIEINPDHHARAGIKIYKDSWKKEVEQLRRYTKVYEIEQGYLLTDLSGCWIYLLKGDFEYANCVSGESKGMTGNFYGLSLESPDMPKSLEIWKVLGFAVTMGSLEKGFIALENEHGFPVSLMQPLSCPHLFFNPSLTFFNGKQNTGVIQNIRAAGIPITEEITVFNDKGTVDNIIIRDPGGYGFFIFND